VDDVDLDYLAMSLKNAEFVPYPWIGEDKNIGAFISRKSLIEWYCQPPGLDGEPYRDRGFYTRELAMLSRIVQPRVVVEFGTSLGIGACLLRWLNPKASLVTVDINEETYMPGDLRVEIGHLAKYQNIACKYVQGNSWGYRRPSGVDLCFVDGDHSYEAVAKDSKRAWGNRAIDHPWAIVWHDYNERHPGVVQAVTEFCSANSLKPQSKQDSDTVWVIGGMS
jgi:hypothetical protein